MIAIQIIIFVAGALCVLPCSAARKETLDAKAHDHRSMEAPAPRLGTSAGHLLLTTPGARVTLSGRVAQEHYAIRNGYTLNDAVSDWSWKFRQRLDLRFYSDFGTKEYGKPAAEAAINFMNMHWWREVYSNLYLKSEPTVVDYQTTTGQLTNVDDSFNQVTQTFFDPTISSHIPVISFTEGWLATHFDTYFSWFKNNPHSFKIGYFPYQLGRGISLGYADEGGIQFLGYEMPRLPFASPYYSPGLLWKGEITKGFGYEFYYSVWRKQYAPSFEKGAIDFRFRLDKNRINKFGKDLYRNVWSGKLLVESSEDSVNKVYGETYFMWMHSTYHRATKEQKLSDRRTNLGTWGLMFDYKYKHLSFNTEVAAQFGDIRMYPFDRNELLLKRDPTGFANEAFTQIQRAPLAPYDGVNPQFDTTQLSAMPAASGLLNIVTTDDVVYLNSQNNTIPIKDPSGNTVIDLQTGNFMSVGDLQANVLNPLFGSGSASANELLRSATSRYVQAYNTAQRVRPGYKIDLQGFMVLADLSYRMVKLPCTLSLAGAYISGDANPFKTEQETRYKGFLPLRDIRYRGHNVQSLALLTARVIPRPCDGNWHQFDSSNLAYVGLGFQCYPLQNEQKLLFESNGLWFFQPADQALFRAGEAESTTLEASKELGFEWNASLTYRPLHNLTMLARGAIFLPGKLYRDRSAQTLNLMTTSGILEPTRLGSDIAWGYHFRIAYAF